MTNCRLNENETGGVRLVSEIAVSKVNSENSKVLYAFELQPERILSKVSFNNCEINSNKGPGIRLRYVRCSVSECLIYENANFAIQLEEKGC